MAELIRITARFALLTPAWLGDARQQGSLRVSSLKGLLRFWYRAIDPAYQRLAPDASLSWESLLFGTAGGGEDANGTRGLGSIRLLELTPKPPVLKPWNAVNADGFSRGTKNGLLYLGFSLKMNAQRKALWTPLEFTLAIDIHPEALKASQAGTLQRLRRGLLASLWLLGTLGSVGTRSRRGFGALQLKGLEATDLASDGGAGRVPPGSPLYSLMPHTRQPSGEKAEGTPDSTATSELEKWRSQIKLLPILASANSTQSWANDVSKTLDTLATWFPQPSQTKSGGATPKEAVKHPHIGDKTSPLLLPLPHKTWEACLNVLGRRLQDFRLRLQPDYNDLKAHAARERRLARAPERAAFGLPLTWRFTSLPGAKPVQIYSFNERSRTANDRHPSLLFLRPVLIQGQYYGLMLRLEGAVPGIHIPATLSTENRALEQPARNLLDSFMNAR